ncbi:polysaccharide pyruvyl transferase family protein [Methanolobus sp.]|uniref:polysaccharide pyruvyl transferase family protein n=1 Tax=Methanolobus sp. TaxID=1874737 RepID=UPI0025D478FB|nr:polysaccharide pyruvyl transferase family protein [Methanolobus sp.]
MVNNILIIKSACRNTKTCEYNRGSFAVVSTTIDTLHKFIPDAEFSTFIQLSKENPLRAKMKVIESEIYTTKYYSLINSLTLTFNLLRCIIWHLFLKVGVDFKFLINSQFLNYFRESDLVIDLSLDAYSDDYGLRSIIETSKEILIPVFLGKTTMIYAQSLGPFKKPINRFLAKYTLSKVNLISAREELSYNNIIELGIKKEKIHQTADQAFLLEPVSRSEALKLVETEDKENHFNMKRPTFGFAISMMKTANEKSSKTNKMIMVSYSFVQYILPNRLCVLTQEKVKNSSMFKKVLKKSLDFVWFDDVIEYLIERYNANIIFVPHIISQQHELFGDDRTAIKRIYDNLSDRNRERVVPIQGNYTSEEIKGIIGLSDIFIGEKMHANVGATSQCVPTIGLAYSHKFYGIMKMLGQEKYVLQNIDANKLIATIDDVWSNKENIRATLKDKLPEIKMMAEENGKLAAGLIKKIDSQSNNR